MFPNPVLGRTSDHLLMYLTVFESRAIVGPAATTIGLTSPTKYPETGQVRKTADTSNRINPMTRIMAPHS